MGTPLGGERKSRRMRSPLHEMDDDVVTDLFGEGELVPQNPDGADTVHVGATGSNGGLLN